MVTLERWTSSNGCAWSSERWSSSSKIESMLMFGLGREAVGAGQGEGPAAPLLVQRAGDPAQVGHLERPEEVVGLDVQGVGGVGA
jgi:hypothetical protein